MNDFEEYFRDHLNDLEIKVSRMRKEIKDLNQKLYETNRSFADLYHKWDMLLKTAIGFGVITTILVIAGFIL